MTSFIIPSRFRAIHFYTPVITRYYMLGYYGNLRDLGFYGSIPIILGLL